MINQSIPHSLIKLRNRSELIAAVLAGIFLLSFLLVFQSAWMMALLLLSLIVAVAFWWGFEYIPLIVFLQLAFSVELQITSTTRLTVPTEILVPLLFVTYFVSILREGKITYRSSPLNITVILLYFVMVASYRYTLEPVSTFKAIIRDTGYIGAGYYLIPRYIRSEKQIQHILMGGLILHTLLVVYGFLTQLAGGFHIYGNIAGPFFIEHCIYAAFITISFAFVMAFYLHTQNPRYRFWLGIITAIFGVAIILTFVRAAWISVVVLLLFYLYQFRHRKSAVDLLLILIVVSLLVIGIALTTDVGSLILQRLDTITDMRYTANLDRIDRWLAAWKMWGDHPYLGVGWGAYPDQYYKYAPYQSEFLDDYFIRIPYSYGFRMGAHNIYLEILAEAGMVGMVMYLLMLYMFFRRAIILQHRVQSSFLQVFLIAVQGAMITFLFHAFVNNLGPSDKLGITFWFLLGTVPTVEALHRSETRQQDKKSAASTLE